MPPGCSLNVDPLPGLSTPDTGKVDKPIVGIGTKQPDGDLLADPKPLLSLEDPALGRGGDHPA